MKITKNAKNGKVQFYRNMEQGGLRDNKIGNSEDKTESAIEQLDLKKSYTGRILSPDAKRGKGNPFYLLIRSLTGEVDDKLPIEYLREVKIKVADSKEGIEASISKYLSNYGKKLTCEDESTTLESLLLDYYKKTLTDEETETKLEQIQNHIGKLLSHKKGNLKTSFQNNAIPFEKYAVTGGNTVKFEIHPSSNKMKWLFGFLDEQGANKEKFNHYMEMYHYTNLESELNSFTDEHFFNSDNINGDHIAKKIYGTMKEYNSGLYNTAKNDGISETELQEYSFFLNEIRDHFKKYFPPKGNKSQGRSGNKGPRIKSLTDLKNVKYFYSKDFVYQQVWKHIVNQLVSGLIQYGKLYTYCVAPDSDYQEINSDTMQDIQIQEAIKKQLLLSVIWSVDRMNYYFNYAGDKVEMMYKQDSYDILGELRKSICFGGSNRSGYVSEFVQDIKSNSEKCNKLFKKLSNAFQLNQDENNSKYLINLLHEIVDNLYAIRLKIMHYKKGGLKFNDDTKTACLRGQLNRDINNVQNCFQEQIRSMNISIYYSPELINKLFTRSGLKFKLYASTPSMIPSFKKVYEKGVNLFKGDSDKELKWYLDDKGNTQSKEAVFAYRNLLQLIYYHVYIPSIGEDDRDNLVIPFIARTIKWNKERSYEKQKNNKKTSYKNKGKKTYINANAYRYESMPKYHQGLSLSEYMSALQRAQSDKEITNIATGESEDERKNYFTSFIQDIFAFSFANFLSSRFRGYEDDLLRPQAQTSTVTEETEKLDHMLQDIRIEVSGGLENQAEIYAMLKLLDAKALNELLHQLIRYRTSISHSLRASDPDYFKDFSEIEELINLVAYTKPVLVKEENYTEILEHDFNTFLEGKPTEYDDLYVQSDLSTTVLHRNIANMGYTGVMALYNNIFKNSYCVTRADHQKYKNMKTTENKEESVIAAKQKKLQELHEKFVKKQKISNTERNQYKDTLAEVQNYNHLKRKVTFDSMYEIYQIHAQILGRLASFAEDWERDMRFLFTALVEKGKIHTDIEEMFHKGRIVGKIKKGFACDCLPFQLIYSLYGLDYQYQEKKDIAMKKKDFEKVLQTRNILAHINHVTQKKDEDGSYQSSLEELINWVRQLLSYDIKRQNSVITAIKKIFDEHQMTIEFTPYRGNRGEQQFKIKKIESKKITHLKNLGSQSIKIPACNQEQLEWVRELMQYKYSGESANL